MSGGDDLEKGRGDERVHFGGTGQREARGLDPSARVSRWLPGPVTAQPPGDMGLCPPSVQPWVGAWDLQGVPHLPSFLTSAVGLPSEAGWGSTVPLPVPLLTGLVHLGDTEIGEAKEQDRNGGEQQVHVLCLHRAGVSAGGGCTQRLAERGTCVRTTRVPSLGSPAL